MGQKESVDIVMMETPTCSSFVAWPGVFQRRSGTSLSVSDVCCAARRRRGRLCRSSAGVARHGRFPRQITRRSNCTCAAEASASELGDDSSGAVFVDRRSRDGREPPLASRLPRVYMIIGGPGCGKGTQCKRLTQDFPQLRQLTASDVLKKEIGGGSALGQHIESVISEGGVVSGDIILRLLHKELESSVCQGISDVLLDGFPRSLEQMNEYETHIGAYEMAVHFECRPSVLFERMQKRAVKLKRDDDEESVMHDRIQRFVDSHEEILDYFRARNRLVTVEAGGDVDDVYSQMHDLFKGILARA